MPHKLRSDANEWKRQDKIKNPEKWDLLSRITWLQRKLKWIEDPKAYQEHLAKQRAYANKRNSLSKTITPIISI